MIKRILEEKVRASIGTGKAIIIMGARQVGKSTLLHQIFDGMDGVRWYDADNSDVRELLSDRPIGQLRTFFGSAKFIVIDEAQHLQDAGITLKRIHDQIPEVQIFATGSSSFELADSINEPMTGRKRELQIYPLSFAEMVTETDMLTEVNMLPLRLLYGYYPEIVTSHGEERRILTSLTNDYLYRDILSIDNIKKGDSITNLLKAIAFLIGSPVSYYELGQMTGLDSKTVEKYINVLEKSFVLFRLNSFSRNLRNELKKSRKIYFYDLGIRNAVINNFTQIENRAPHEVGHMWENFIIAERLKKNQYAESFSNLYFWRTQQAKEVDLIEESDGQLSAYEIKWDAKSKVSAPIAFSEAYPEASFSVVNPENFFELLV